MNEAEALEKLIGKAFAHGWTLGDRSSPDVKSIFGFGGDKKFVCRLAQANGRARRALLEDKRFQEAIKKSEVKNGKTETDR